MKDGLLATRPGPSARAHRFERAECYEHTPRFDDPAVESSFLHVAIYRVAVQRADQCTTTCAHSCTASGNTGAGVQALQQNTTAFDNTATGALTLQKNTIGQLNTATGTTALTFNSTGNNNTADGAAALQANTTGSNNTAVGFGALQSNTTG